MDIRKLSAKEHLALAVGSLYVPNSIMCLFGDEAKQIINKRFSNLVSKLPATCGVNISLKTINIDSLLEVRDTLVEKYTAGKYFNYSESDRHLLAVNKLKIECLKSIRSRKDLALRGVLELDPITNSGKEQLIKDVFAGVRDVDTSVNEEVIRVQTNKLRTSLLMAIKFNLIDNYDSLDADMFFYQVVVCGRSPTTYFKRAIILKLVNAEYL